MKNIQIILNAILSQDVFEYILIDKNYTITNFSEGLSNYIGTTPKVGDEVMDCLPELVGYEEKIDTIFDNEDFRYILETIHKNNYYINVHLEHYDDDTAMILLHNTTEITLSKLELLQYSNENTLLYSTIQKILDSQNNLLVVAHNNVIEYANKRFMEYFSLRSMDDLKDRTLYNFGLTSLKVNNFEELYEYAKDKEQKVTIGEDTFLVKATLLEKTYKLFTLSNITHLNNINQALKSKIDFDPLTGIYRKQFFDTKLIDELKEDSNFTLVVIDIDDFKKINDTYGHLVGDKVLKEFTSIIQSHLRQGDIFSRWGGEEFLILIKCYTKEPIIEKIEHIRQLIEKHQFDGVGSLTSSFGITISHSTDTIDTIYKRADEALYQAKKLGKNRVVCN